MSGRVQVIERVHAALYDPDSIARTERAVIIVAAVAFLVHLAFITVFRFTVGEHGHWFSSSYLGALYTPFSFLLFYEVLLLAAAISESFSRSVAVQLEVVMLIVMRRVFKDIAHLDGFDTVSLENPDIVHALSDMLGAFLLFLIARRFTAGLRPSVQIDDASLAKLVVFKKGLAILLGAFAATLALYSFFEWAVEMYALGTGEDVIPADTNAIFYEDFFGVLVLVDVLLLLLSFAVTRDKHLVFRNMGFIASAVIVRLSFSAPRLQSLALLLFASVFALLVQVTVNRLRDDDVDA